MHFYLALYRSHNALVMSPGAPSPSSNGPLTGWPLLDDLAGRYGGGGDGLRGEDTVVVVVVVVVGDAGGAPWRYSLSSLVSIPGLVASTTWLVWVAGADGS